MGINRRILNNTHFAQLSQWELKNDSKLTQELKDNYQRYYRYGLCGITKNILSFLKLYPNFETQSSKTLTLAYTSNNNEVLGLVILEFCHENNINYLCVNHLIINPNLLHKGIGTYILTDLLENGNSICEYKCDDIYISTESSNIPMNNLLNKLGFTKSKDINFNIYSNTIKGKNHELW